jgi:hypothetical protein
MSEPRHTDEKLVIFSEHLFYEVDMLARTAGILADPGLWELQRTNNLGYSIANGLMESWVVHARILIEFLHKDPGGRQPDTVTIVDYISDPCLRDICPELEKVLTIKDAYIRACTEVVHPSIDRNWRYEDTKQGKSLWEFASITRALLTQIREVARRIPSERISEAYRTAILAVSYDGPVAEVRLDRSSSDGRPGLFFAEVRPPSAIGYTGTTTAPPQVRGWTGYRDPAATKSA